MAKISYNLNSDSYGLLRGIQPYAPKGYKPYENDPSVPFQGLEILQAGKGGNNKFLKQGTTVTYFVPDSYEGHQKLQDYHLQQLSPLLFEKDSLLSNEELITKYTGLPHFNLPNSWSSIYKITAKPGEILIPSSSKTCLEKLDLLSLLKKGIRFIQCDKNVVAGIDPKGYLPEMECVINAVPLRR